MADDRNQNDSKTPRSEAISNNEQWWLRFVPKSKQWSDVNISRFLSIYKAHSILWDPTHPFYTDKPKRTKAYNIIARKINLYGIKGRECIKLLESLKNLYAEEKKRQTIARNCSQKYSPPPSWYPMLEEIIECVQRKLEESARKDSVQAEPAKPWEACCPRLYTEDIWMPEHFKTNVTNWFLTLQDEQLVCTSKESSGPNLTDSNTETSSTYYRDLTSDSSSHIDRCVDQESSPSSNTCCCSTLESIKLPEQCGANVNNDEMYTCDARKGNIDRISTCEGKAPIPVKTTTRCPSKNTRKEHKIDRISTCEGDAPILVNESVSENTNMSQEGFCTMQTTTHGSGGNVIISSNSKASSTTESHYTCRSLYDSSTTAVITSDGSSRSGKSLLSECRSIPESQESDHRLDYFPDPTLCEKCAVDRVPVRGVYKNVAQSEDPRMPELDKYCRYKDWDAIYNIRTQVPDQDLPIIQMDEDWLLTMSYKDKPQSPTRQNHSPMGADINLFIDPDSSEAREVGLNNEYKWEYGLNIKIDQPRHYACEDSQVPGHKPAQLIL